MTEFRRNQDTGILEVWKDGKKTGEIWTMGDEIYAERDTSGQQRTSSNSV